LSTVYRAIHPSLGDRPAVLITVRFLLSFAVLFGPTTLIGMALPILVRTLTGRYQEIGERLPRRYAWNTVGSFLGAVSTGYLLLGLLGVRGSLYVAVAINVVVGTAALWLSRHGTSHSVVQEAAADAHDRHGKWHPVALAVTFLSVLPPSVTR
jgi:predicted membrane-bound spermidine synthase